MRDHTALPKEKFEVDTTRPDRRTQKGITESQEKYSHSKYLRLELGSKATLSNNFYTVLSSRLECGVLHKPEPISGDSAEQRACSYALGSDRRDNLSWKS